MGGVSIISDLHIVDSKGIEAECFKRFASCERVKKFQ